jgi:hypothetical protein
MNRRQPAANRDFRLILLKWIAGIALFISNATVYADTGTYEILDYQIVLTPGQNGQVEIEYYQKWHVTGGSIPWITLGVPNKNFTLIPVSDKKNASSILSDNQTNWSGVKIYLDKNYIPGDIFEIRFKIMQQWLLYQKNDRCILEFTPGWYDRADIHNLTLKVNCPCKHGEMIISPQTANIQDNQIIWHQKLQSGDKFRIQVSLPGHYFNALPTKPSVALSNFEFSSIIAFLPFLVILPLVIFFIFGIRGGLRSGSNYGNGGRIYYGHSGYLGPGYHSSCACACACVSCACACACAGGSAAGCDRKQILSYSLCRQCKCKEDCLRYRLSV